MVSGEGYVQFNNINLNRVDTTSGVFIGNNTAIGWRSISKSNEGFGSAKGCRIHKTINILFDNDGIDTVINNYQEIPMELVPAISQSQNDTINFQSLNVNAINLNSSINMGENLLNEWRTHQKVNMGFGNVTGINILSGNANLIDDQDIIDTHIEETNRVRGAQDNKSPL